MCNWSTHFPKMCYKLYIYIPHRRNEDQSPAAASHHTALPLLPLLALPASSSSSSCTSSHSSSSSSCTSSHSSSSPCSSSSSSPSWCTHCLSSPSCCWCQFTVGEEIEGFKKAKKGPQSKREANTNEDRILQS